MKKLLTLVVLGLALNLPAVSFANTNVFGVSTPIMKQQVSDQIKGGIVEKDRSSFYLSNKDRKQFNTQMVSNNDSSNDDLIVFGVKI